MSMDQLLSDARITDLYEQFLAAAKTQAYLQKQMPEYRDVLEWVKNATDSELLSVEGQRILWTKTRALGSAGPGENVNTDRAHADTDVAEAIVGLRRKSWPTEPTARARQLQEEHDRILAMVYPALCKRRPKAKLKRVFLALLPGELHRALAWGPQEHIAKLVQGNDAAPSIATDVLVRARLQTLLGPESTLLEHTRRSFFCWWLHERYDHLVSGVTRVVPDPTLDDAETSDAPPTLTLWSFAAQRKGIPPISGFLDTLQAVLRHSQSGAGIDDIVESMRQEEELARLKPKSCRDIISLVKFLGLIELQNGLWYPSEDGKATLAETHGDVSERLIERVLERIFGMAQLLRIIATNGPQPKPQIISDTRLIYPRWATDFVAKSLVAWADVLGLIERRDDGDIDLSELGSYWHARLPHVLPTEIGADVPESLSDLDMDEIDSNQEQAPWTPPRFADLWAAWQRDDETSRLIVSREQLLEVHLAWHVTEPGYDQPKKRFVILSGLSGTGKTAILRHYARIYCQLCEGLEIGEHRAVIPVAPDWHDPSSLLGYVSILGREPAHVPGPALTLLMSAARRPHQPFFLILDEMNLAHVERYFAPFLSAMETGDRLELYGHTEDIDGIPQSIRWPRNMFIGGTVNMDETTHSISDKVLDRAFTLEFWRVELSRFCDGRKSRDTFPGADDVHTFLSELNDDLAKVRRHVGYRAAGETLEILRVAAAQDELTDETVWTHFDHAIQAKILPRLRGHDSEELRHALTITRDRCQARGLRACVSKLETMLQRLAETGMTRFFG